MLHELNCTVKTAETGELALQLTKEEEFDFDNRPYLFVDVETGEQIKIHSSEVRESYVRSMHDFKKELIHKCAQYHIDFVEADIHQGYRQVLLPYLLKRERMSR